MSKNTRIIISDFNKLIDSEEMLLTLLLINRETLWSDKEGFFCIRAMGANLYGKCIDRKEENKIENGMKGLIKEGYVCNLPDSKNKVYHLDVSRLSTTDKFFYYFDFKYINMIYQKPTKLKRGDILKVFLFILTQRSYASSMGDDYRNKIYTMGNYYISECLHFKRDKVKDILTFLEKNKILYSNHISKTGKKNDHYLRDQWCLYEDKNLLVDYTIKYYGYNTTYKQNDRIKKLNKSKNLGLYYYYVCNDKGKYDAGTILEIISYLNTSNKYFGLDCYSPVIKYCDTRHIDISSEIQDLNIPIEVKDLFSTSKNL